MKRVEVKGRFGETSSVIPHSSGRFPVWFDDGSFRFVNFEDVRFL